jgi:hypothetical protein
LPIKKIAYPIEGHRKVQQVSWVAPGGIHWDEDANITGQRLIKALKSFMMISPVVSCRVAPDARA